MQALYKQQVTEKIDAPIPALFPTSGTSVVFSVQRTLNFDGVKFGRKFAV